MQAILVDNDSGYRARLADVTDQQLPDGNVTVDVRYSTLNYKDSLAITGASPVVRSFPMVPGVDFAGTVTASDDPNWSVGDEVILNGWGVGETHWGGYAERAQVDGDWLVSLPDALDVRQAMAIGTAGYTAMLCVMALEAGGVEPGDGEVLVTGATGGVGSVAIALLSGLGHQVVASTGSSESHDYLQRLGATAVIDRAELSEPSRPLGKERWAGVVDSVGSHTLANGLAATRYGGTVAACGLAQGMDLPGTVMPFILRGVTLAGIDSVRCPIPTRIIAWERLGSDLDLDLLEEMSTEVLLGAVLDLASKQLAGEIQGRTIVKVEK